jgi:hypothetical protein
MKNRGPSLPKPFNLGRGDRAKKQNKLRAIDLRRATDIDDVNNESKGDSGTRPELLHVHRNRDRRSDAETESNGRNSDEETG